MRNVFINKNCYYHYLYVYNVILFKKNYQHKYISFMY